MDQSTMKLLTDKELNFEQDQVESNWRKLSNYISSNDLTHYQTTNFRLFQTEKSLQTTISDLTKMAESYPNG